MNPTEMIEIAEAIHSDFKRRPFDFLSMEIEAQVQVVNYLRDRERAGALIKYTVNGIKGLENTESSRFKLEWKLEDKWKHDIIAVKKETKAPLTLVTRADIDFFIEIKVGWGYSETHFSYEGAEKDLNLVKNFDNGYFFFFLGNSLESMPEYKKHYEKARESIPSGRFFAFFLDKLLY